MNYAELLARHDELVTGLKSNGCEIVTDEHGVAWVRNARAEKAEKRIEEMKASGMVMLGHEMARTRECLQLREENADLAKKDAYWFGVLQKCATLLDLPDNEPIPSGVLRRVQEIVGEQS